jgi:hypothetical protein
LDGIFCHFEKSFIIFWRSLFASPCNFNYL